MARSRDKLTKSEQMARVRSRNTSPELLVRQALWKAGLRYRLHASLPGTPDLVFLGARVAVFIDGCFWHGCPEHYTAPKNNAAFWKQKVQRNVERDQRVIHELRRQGWISLRIWEHEVIRGLPIVVERIAALVRGQ